MKQRSKRVKALLLVFTTLTIALSGCGNAGDETGGKNSSQITVGIAQDLEDSLDPHKAEAAEQEKFCLMCLKVCINRTVMEI